MCLTFAGQSYNNGMRSAFAVSAELPVEAGENNRLVDLPMCSAASIDQLLPNMGLISSMAFPWETTFSPDKAPSYALPIEMF